MLIFMRTEIALYLNGPKYSSAGASGLFATGGGLAFGGPFVAPAVAASSARPNTTVRIMLLPTPGCRRSYPDELGLRNGPYRVSLELGRGRRVAARLVRPILSGAVPGRGAALPGPIGRRRDRLAERSSHFAALVATLSAGEYLQAAAGHGGAVTRRPWRGTPRSRDRVRRRRADRV